MKDINLFKLNDSVYLRKVRSKEDVLKDLDCDGFLIRGSEKIVRSIIASLKDKIRNQESGIRNQDFLIGIYGGGDAFNRRAIETLDIDYLVSPEGGFKRDSLKQRDSGLNHVVAKKAVEKDVEIVVDIGEVSRLEGKEKAKRLSRIMQNVRICRKVGCRVLVASLGKKRSEVFNEKGRRAFGEALGMSSVQVRDCVLFD